LDKTWERRSPRGDKNKIEVSNYILKSTDFGGRETPSDQGAGEVIVRQKHIYLESFSLFPSKLIEFVNNKKNSLKDTSA